MSNNMTIKRQFENYRPNEYINAVKATPDREIVSVAVPRDEFYQDWYGRKIAVSPEIFHTGPIIDRLAAYERTYMEPEEIKELQDDAKCMKDKIKSLEKEVEAWKKDAEKWKNRYGDIKETLESHGKGYDELQDECVNLRRVNWALNNGNDELGAKNEKLKKESEAKDKKIEELEKYIEDQKLVKKSRLQQLTIHMESSQAALYLRNPL